MMRDDAIGGQVPHPSPTGDNRLSPRWRRRARVLRPWRWALLIYAIALTVATHWPRLELSPEIPASDKMIHMAAFGLLAALLWRSELLSNRWLVYIVTIAWAGADELSQGLPGIHRTVSIYDMIANVCGISCAMALIWSMAPLQNAEQLEGPDRSRTRLFEFTFDEMFSRRSPWIILMIVLGLGAALIALVRTHLPSPRAVGIFGIVVAVVALHALYLVYRRIFFARFEGVLRERPCLQCGADAAAARPAAQGVIECGACEADRSDGHYLLPPRPSLGAVLAVSVVPALIALLGIATMFAMVFALPYVYGWTISTPSGRVHAPRIAQMFGRLPPELSSAFDLTAYLLLLAVVIRMWRRRMAAHVDRAVRCRRCGHDLHGTPINARGEGRCGECGAAFLRKA